MALWLRVPGGLRLLLPLAEMAILWWLSSREPLMRVSSATGSLLHNMAHVVAYAGLSASTAASFRPTGPRSPRALVLGVAIAFVYGVVDEVHQSCVPGRVASFADVGSDLCGAVLGACAVQYAWTRRGRWLGAAFAALAVGVGTAALATFTSI